MTLRNDGGRIECRVNEAPDGAGSEPSTFYVVAVAQFPAAMPLLQAGGASPGTMAMIGNMAPGDYAVAAFDEMPKLDLDDAEKLARMLSKAQKVHVEANGTAKVQLELTHVRDAGAAR
jgi:hypothetical protein